MAQANYISTVNLPVRRKRGRPRKDETLVCEPPLRSQRQHANSTCSFVEDLVGHVVTGNLDGTFEGGYTLTVRAGTSGPVLKGLLFDPRLSSPITAENDIAPDLPMMNPKNSVVPEASNLADIQTADQSASLNVRTLDLLPRREQVDVPSPTQSVHQSVRTGQSVQGSESDILHFENYDCAPLDGQVHVGVGQSLERENSTTQSVAMHHNAIDSPSLQRNEQTVSPTEAFHVQQNVTVNEPVQIDAPSVVHMPVLQLMELNVNTAQSVARDDSAASFTEPQPEQPNSTPAPPPPKVIPAILSQINQTCPASYAEEVVLSDARSALEPDLKYEDSHVSTEAPVGLTDPSSSALNQTPQFEVNKGQNALEISSDVVPDEQALVDILASDNQSGGVLQQPKEIGSTIQMMEPQVLVVEGESESKERKLKLIESDPEKPSQVGMTSAPEASKLTLGDGSSEASPCTESHQTENRDLSYF